MKMLRFILNLIVFAGWIISGILVLSLLVNILMSV